MIHVVLTGTVHGVGLISLQRILHRQPGIVPTRKNGSFSCHQMSHRYTVCQVVGTLHFRATFYLSSAIFSTENRLSSFLYEY